MFGSATQGEVWVLRPGRQQEAPPSAEQVPVFLPFTVLVQTDGGSYTRVGGMATGVSTLCHLWGRDPGRGRGRHSGVGEEVLSGRRQGARGR